jgi:hypothetical protein
MAANVPESGQMGGGDFPEGGSIHKGAKGVMWIELFQRVNRL